MNISNVSFCSSNPNLIPSFEAAYYSLGFIFLIYGIAYIIYSLKSPSPQMQSNGSQGSQISFIICLFARGIGLIINAILISKKISLSTISLFTSGLPGYLTAVAYTFIFFSWCNLCVEVLSKDSKEFFIKTQRSLFWILFMLILIFVIVLIIFFCRK